MNQLKLYSIAAVRKMDYAKLTDEMVLMRRVRDKYRNAIIKTSQVIEHFDKLNKSHLVEPQRRNIMGYALDLKELDAYLQLLNYRLHDLADQVDDQIDLFDLF